MQNNLDENPPSDTAPSDTAPSESASSESAPSDTAPSESASSETAPSDTAPSESASSESAPSETNPSETAPGEVSESTPVPESAKLFGRVADSFKEAQRQEMKHSHKAREAWYKSIGEAHHLVGILRSDNALKGYLEDSLEVRQHKKTSDQLHLLKLIYKQAKLNIPAQTQHDHSMILIGLKAAGIPNDADAAEKWLKEEENLDGKQVVGKDKAMIYAKRAQKNRPPNKAAETRVANAERKRQEQFESYIAPKLRAPLADLSIPAGSSKLADGYYVVVMLQEGDRIRLLDAVADDEKTVQTTALRQR